MSLYGKKFLNSRLAEKIILSLQLGMFDLKCLVMDRFNFLEITPKYGRDNVITFSSEVELFPFV